MLTPDAATALERARHALGVLYAEGFHVEAAALSDLIDLCTFHAQAVAAVEEKLRFASDFIVRHGYSMADWPKPGCEQIGPNCPGRCIARCEDIDNLHVTIASLKDRAHAAEQRVRELEQAQR